LAKHRWKYVEQWFGFLSNPSVAETNSTTEPAVPPAVVNRKVCGANRTRRGSAGPRRAAVSVEDVSLPARSSQDHVSYIFRGVGNLLLPHTMLRPTR
jgi:hypothetical protein